MPEPGRAEVLVRVDAIGVCATDIEVLKHGVPAMVDGGLPFNRGFTPGHAYMGTVVRLGPTVDEFEIGDRIAVEVHAGCGRCRRCREGMYTHPHLPARRRPTAISCARERMDDAIKVVVKIREN